MYDIVAQQKDENNNLSDLQQRSNSQTQTPLEPAYEKSQTEPIKPKDPFDKVVLTKNMDNAILTSFRTLSK